MFYLLYKEQGLSSFKAINSWAKSNNIKKVGHTGTLDPMAMGLLLIATDSDTKLIDCIESHDKTYKVQMELGYETDTLDAEGSIIHTSKKVEDHQNVLNAINSFDEVSYEQMPPHFSAKKINGQRAYDLARNGIVDFELKPKLVKIYQITNAKWLGNNAYEFTTNVSNGTYIRSLVRDIAYKLDNFATMTFLERTKIHNLEIELKNTFIDWKKLFNGKVISDKKIIRNIFEGKDINTNIFDEGDNLLVIEDELVGMISFYDNKIVKSKLLGTKMKGILWK